MAKQKKFITYIPIHISIDESEDIPERLKEIKRDLSQKAFGTYGGSYSFEKKFTSQKDIIIKPLN